MHTPTTTMRALPGAADMIPSITPGTPTHSKITAGLTAGPGIHGGSIGAFDGSLYTAISRQLCVRRLFFWVDDDVRAHLQRQFATSR